MPKMPARTGLVFFFAMWTIIVDKGVHIVYNYNYPKDYTNNGGNNMIVKIKKYVATVAHYVEEGDKITKVMEDITITGKRIKEATVNKQIPRGCVLVKHGYVEECYEVDTDILHAFCKTAGELLTEGNAEVEPDSDAE